MKRPYKLDVALDITDQSQETMLTLHERCDTATSTVEYKNDRIIRRLRSRFYRTGDAADKHGMRFLDAFSKVIGANNVIVTVEKMRDLAADATNTAIAA